MNGFMPYCFSTSPLFKGLFLQSYFCIKIFLRLLMLLNISLDLVGLRDNQIWRRRNNVLLLRRVNFNGQVVKSITLSEISFQIMLGTLQSWAELCICYTLEPSRRFMNNRLSCVANTIILHLPHSPFPNHIRFS